MPAIFGMEDVRWKIDKSQFMDSSVGVMFSTYLGRGAPYGSQTTLCCRF